MSDWGLKRQVSSIDLGRTASEIKTTIGANPFGAKLLYKA